MRNLAVMVFGLITSALWAAPGDTTRVNVSTSTPTYAKPTQASSYLYFPTDTGYLWVINPSQPLLSVPPFPTHAQTSIPTIDLAMDTEGAIAYITGAGVVKADWGP